MLGVGAIGRRGDVRTRRRPTRRSAATLPATGPTEREAWAVLLSVARARAGRVRRAPRRVRERPGDPRGRRAGRGAAARFARIAAEGDGGATVREPVGGGDRRARPGSDDRAGGAPGERAHGRHARRSGLSGAAPGDRAAAAGPVRPGRRRRPVGARTRSRSSARAGRPSAAGSIAARIGGGDRRAGAVVVSGLAVGIDGAAHAAVVAERRPTVARARLGPRPAVPARPRAARRSRSSRAAAPSCRSCGPTTPPTEGTFPQRNRVISGLADATIVVEAGRAERRPDHGRVGARAGSRAVPRPGPIDEPRSAGCLPWLREYPGEARIVAAHPGADRRTSACSDEVGRRPTPRPARPGPAGLEADPDRARRRPRATSARPSSAAAAASTSSSRRPVSSPRRSSARSRCSSCAGSPRAPTGAIGRPVDSWPMTSGPRARAGEDRLKRRPGRGDARRGPAARTGDARSLGFAVARRGRASLPPIAARLTREAQTARRRRVVPSEPVQETVYLRKLAAAILAAPVIAAFYVPVILRRSIAAGSGWRSASASLIGLGALGAIAPAQTTANLRQAPIVPLASTAFTSAISANTSLHAPVTLAFSAPMDPTKRRGFPPDPAERRGQSQLGCERDPPDDHAEDALGHGTYHTISVLAGALGASGRPMAFRPARHSSPAVRRPATSSRRTGAVDARVSTASGSASTASRSKRRARASRSTRRSGAASPPRPRRRGAVFVFQPAAPLLAATTYRVAVDGVADAGSLAVGRSAVTVDTSLLAGPPFPSAPSNDQVDRAAVLRSDSVSRWSARARRRHSGSPPTESPSRGRSRSPRRHRRRLPSRRRCPTAPGHDACRRDGGVQARRAIGRGDQRPPRHRPEHLDPRRRPQLEPPSAGRVRRRELGCG